MSRASASVGFSPTRWNGARKMPNFMRRIPIEDPSQFVFALNVLWSSATRSGSRSLRRYRIVRAKEQSAYHVDERTQCDRRLHMTDPITNDTLTLSPRSTFEGRSLTFDFPGLQIGVA